MLLRSLRVRRGLLLPLLGALLGLTTLLVPAESAHAHGTGTPTPADGEILRGTPERILLELPGDGPVVLELRNADGDPIAFTGEIERAPGVVRALPPVLEYGTYILEWSSANGDGWSTFSVGKPDATISGVRKNPRPPLILGAGILLLLLGVATARATGGRVATRGITGGAEDTAHDSLEISTVIVEKRMRRAGHAMPEDTENRRSGASHVLARVFAGISIFAGAAVLAPPNSVNGMVTFLLLGLGSVGAALLVAGDTGTVAPGALTVTGLALLPAYAAAGIVRNTTANPFSPPSLLALGTMVLLLTLVIPINVTGLLARRRGTERSPVARSAALAAFLVLGAFTSTFAVDTRIDAIREETRPAPSCLLGTNRLQIQRCLDSSLVATAREESVVVALDTLKRLLGTESRARFFCHEASHAIGRESLRMNGNLADAFRDGYDVCDFGYYHGIVEGAAGGFDDQKFLDAVPTLCEEFASAEELFYMQCNHGIGHAAARRTNNDMVRALAFCDALKLNPNLTGERLRIAENGCGTGVTMEWFATATADPNAAVTPKVSRPRDVCLSIPEHWVSDCIEYVGNTLDASEPAVSLREIASWCETTQYVERCYRGIARAAAGVGIAARDAISVCEGATSRAARDECVSLYIAFVATTIDYSVYSVDRICQDLPQEDREGPLSLCQRIRAEVIAVLASGDGK